MSEADETDRARCWRAHCHRMADATYALADRCEDPEMLRGYVELAARWIRMADDPQT
jgi:hypothetical protein